jgi:leucyl/phenylalanyl-tRNA--protein transferase
MAQFDARDLLSCYARGVFPMADARDDERVFLIDPERRGILPLGDFHVSRRLARTVRADPFEVKTDTDFREVVRQCAEAGPGRPETWINHPIEDLYVRLFELGHAHSVECWKDGVLVGGLYGVALQGAFFGESMFSRMRDASKVALTHLVARLILGGYRLLDAQFMTDHLTQFGAVEISRLDYHRRLSRALSADADFQRVGVAGAASGAGAALGVAEGGAPGAGFGAAGEALAAGGTGGAGRGAGATGTETIGAGGGLTGAVVLQVISQAS